MFYRKYFYFSIVVILFFTACTQKLTVKALVPAEVGDKDIKNVVIEKFKNDDVFLSSSINSKMSQIKFNDKNYFNIVNREDTDKILEEQKFQDSGLVDDENDDNILSSISSIISGEINSKTHIKRVYTERRTDFDRCIQYVTSKDGEKYCSLYREYNVFCDAYIYSITANIKITRVSNTDIIFSKTYNSSFEQKSCKDEYKKLLSEQATYELISSNIANDFVSLISPSYKFMSLTLIKNEDIDYTSKQEKMLENALKLIDLKDIRSANNILRQLVESTNNQSSTALYDLGITYEYLGDLENALQVYQKAKDITLLDDIDENIINSVERIKKSIEEKNRANKQIEN